MKQDDVLWAACVRNGGVVYDIAPFKAHVYFRKSDAAEVVAGMTQEWRDQDPARKTKPSPWAVAKFVRAAC